MRSQFGIAAVLLNWNAIEQTCECIEMLDNIKTLPVKIVVVDNGSIDNSVLEIREKFPNVQLICNDENLGFSGGNNSALREILAVNATTSGSQNAYYRYILLLNTDAGIDERSLEILLATLEQHDDVGVTGPVFVDKNNDKNLISAGGLDPSLYVNTYQSAEKVVAKLEKGEPFTVDYVSGTVALIRASTLIECGLFEEKYFFSCEMADLCFTFRKHGYDCQVTPESKAWHEMKKAGNRRNTLYLYYILRNRFLFIRRCKNRYVVPLYGLWIVICSFFFLRSILGGRIKTARSVFLALRDGLLGRFGNRNYMYSNILQNER